MFSPAGIIPGIGPAGGMPAPGIIPGIGPAGGMPAPGIIPGIGPAGIGSGNNVVCCLFIGGYCAPIGIGGAPPCTPFGGTPFGVSLLFQSEGGSGNNVVCCFSTIERHPRVCRTNSLTQNGYGANVIVRLTSNY